MGSNHRAPTCDVLSKLKLEEKISLLAAKDWWRTPTIQRDDVFVPHIKTTDGPNGARGESYVSGLKAACFPCSTSLGATFDVDILYETGRHIAKEAITKSASVLLAPTVNVIRSPLGGRNFETYSEDPLVLGVLGAAFVNGCQSVGIAATPKHFVANEAENRRKFLSAEIDEQTLREIYLRPFQLIMKLSNPWCFMTSYNRVNGKYVADDRRLVDNVLRKEWGFSGLVMSDWMGTYSTADAINAGVDLEMPGPTLFRGEKLLQAVKDHQVSEETIDTSAQRILELAERLGRFEAPEEAPEIELENPERDGFICTAAAEGMVLLKNTNQTLPIAPGSSVAVIGHLARSVSLGGGGSAKVNALHAVTPVQGLDSLGVNYTFEPGVPVFGAVPHADATTLSQTSCDDLPGMIERPVKLEWFNGLVVGENLVHQEMLPFAEYMIKEAWPTYLDENYCTRMTFDITPTTSGKHTLSIITTGTASLYIDGEKVYDRTQEPKLVMESFYFFKSKIERRFTHPMEAGRRYTLRVESWRTEPEALARVKGVVFQGSALRFFEYIDIPAAIASAAETARKSDYAVICIGNTNEIESEGYDRETIDLPGEQCRLIQAVAAQNPKTIVVNFSGGPVAMTSFVDSVPAVLQAWFPGQECGHSVAKILVGQINPGGRLPFSWPKKLEDNPSYHNFPVDENDLLRYEEGLDIGYRYYDRKNTPEPLFPFGFGLSYTTFHLSDIKASDAEMINGRVEVSCLATNIGNRSGQLVVQFYVEMPTVTSGLLRPVKELKSFAKVLLESHESKSVVIELDKYSISFYDVDTACWRAQKGDYVVHVGTSTRDIAGSVQFSVPEGFTWTGV